MEFIFELFAELLGHDNQESLSESVNTIQAKESEQTTDVVENDTDGLNLATANIFGVVNFH